MSQSLALKKFSHQFDGLAKPTQNGCLEWQGYLDTNGYGYISLKGRNFQAHRLSYAHHNGEFPQYLVVRHTCDNKKCVNPQHLLLGTYKDNTQDAVSRGRMASGTRNGRAKLTEKDVAEIRELRRQGATLKELGRRFSVDHTTIGDLLNGKTWTTVT